MSALEGLTALEREQLRYIVERVPEWPEGHDGIWSSSEGLVSAKLPTRQAWLVNARDAAASWSKASPNFTRAQYDAMKAEMDSPDICAACKRSHDAGTTCCPDCIRRLEAERDRVAAERDSIDYRAHCEALAEALEPLTRDAPKGLCTDDLLAHFAEMRRVAVLALTRWKEDSK